jgi:O-antigen ligase
MGLCKSPKSIHHMPSHQDDPPEPIIQWIERGILGCLFLIAIFAPHSIAATQTAWLLGMLLWVLRFVFYPRPRLFRSPIDYALFGFFLLSGLSGIFSYSLITSIGKMRAASLFTIVYLISQNVGSLKIARLLAFALIGSCVLSVFLTAGQLVIGKGVKIDGLKSESPLTKANFRTRTVSQLTPITNGDIIWEVNGQRVDTPEEIAGALAGSVTFDPRHGGPSPAKVRIYRVEWTPVLEVPRGQLLPGTNALDQLGISNWSRGRDWRATGFFGHWVTYAEVLQLIVSLALGLFLGLSGKKSIAGLLLLLAVFGLLFALGMTVTRASWIGFGVSALLMLALSASRRTLVIVVAACLPLVLASAVFLQQKRSIGFFDRNDQSTSWRETVWREGFQLLVSKPRHLLVGVGMDSIKGHWRRWRMFDNGRLPVGHMHSNILQIALERGVPALIVWLLLIGVYVRMLLKIIGRRKQASIGNRQSAMSNLHDFPLGLALGALGGITGFFVSGLVHYNWGDSEVVTVVYLIMGLNLVVERIGREAGTV